MIGNSLARTCETDASVMDMQINAIRQDSEHFRKHRRLELTAPLRVYPGKIANGTEIVGICQDISRSGLGAILNKAAPVGESMWLIINDDKFSDGPVHAQCVRCRMLPQSLFEAGFLFFSHLDLPE